MIVRAIPTQTIMKRCHFKQSMITTTLNKIRKSHPCEDGWKKLLKYLGKTKADDELLLFSVIVESNGLEDALWCCHIAPEYYREWRLFAVWWARQVQHFMKDPRSIAVLDIAERYANGLATETELWDARQAAWAAVRDAVRNEEMAKNTIVENMARVAENAARTAAEVAGDAANVVRRVADNAARVIPEIWDETWEAQRKEFLRIVG